MHDLRRLWDEHYRRVKKLVQDVKQRVPSNPSSSSSPSPPDGLPTTPVPSPPSYFLTICGTIHPSFSDFPLLFNGWLVRLLYRYRREVKTPKRDMDTIVRATLEFLEAENMLGYLDEHEAPRGGRILNTPVSEDRPKPAPPSSHPPPKRDIESEEGQQQQKADLEASKLGHPGEIIMHFRTGESGSEK